MNIRELIAGIEVELEAAEKRETKARKEIEIIIASAQQEGRSNLTDEEDARCEQLFESIELAKSQQDGIKGKLARARKVEAEEAESDVRMAETHKVTRSAPATRNYDTTVHVGNEERTYSKGTDPYGRQFLADVVKGFTGDVRSQDRLSRHMREEEVERAGTYAAQQIRTSAGVGTAAFSGLVVPQYLLDMVAPAVANLRPFADAANKHPLPETGMSVNISRITTATQAGLQTNQLSTVAWQDAGDTLLTANIQTFSGMQLVSRQAVDRGQGIEDTLMQDLVRQLNTSLDSTLLNQATHGMHTVGNTVAYTSASPTGVEMYPKIVGAASQSATAVRGIAVPDLVVMHPRRWYWLQSQLASVWPLIGSPAQGSSEHQLGQVDTQAYPAALAGRLPCGLGVISDANVTTDSAGDSTHWDDVYVGPRNEAHLWEDSGNPVFIRAEQPYAGQLGVLLVIYEYAAYTFERYANAFQKVVGTGTLAPTGF